MFISFPFTSWAKFVISGHLDREAVNGGRTVAGRRPPVRGDERCTDAVQAHGAGLTPAALTLCRIIHLDVPSRLSRQLLRVERVISALPVEHAFAFTLNGKFLFHQTDGSPDSVLLGPEQETLLKGAVLTHNHPDGRSISEPDLEVAMHFGLRQIRAVTTWARYWVEPPAEGWKLYRQRIRRAIAEERPLVIEALRSDIEAGVVTGDDADRLYGHMLWRRMARRRLLQYGYQFWHLGVT